VTDNGHMAPPMLGSARTALAAALRSYIGGPNASAEAREVLERPGPRWFDEDRPIRRVHSDTSLFIGGLRALLLQSLHPLAMAAIDDYSDYRADPWGRLQRTGHFIGTTTFGTVVDAERAVASVRRVHSRITGTAPDGRSYAASDPHLLGWVHVAEVDSFLRAYQSYGAGRLSPIESDAYVADMAKIGDALGVIGPPVSNAALGQVMAEYRAELQGTPAARDAARFLLLTPPLPLAARPAYSILASAAVADLPLSLRRALRLPWFPFADALYVRPAGSALTAALRWILSADDPSSASIDDRTAASTV
jgi:uncharacterized protein (DUF2236 family)